MFLDASAIIAIIAEESDGAMLAARLDQAAHSYTSPIALYETTLALARVAGRPVAAAISVVDGFLRETGATIIAMDAEIGRDAINAFARFGRGQHPARLNMGDCFSYACARSLGVPLLCKGEDFPQTDIELA